MFNFNEIENAGLNIYEATKSLKEALKKANKSLELAKIDDDMAYIHMIEMENAYNDDKSSLAISMKLDKAYADYEATNKAYDNAYNKVETLKSAIEALNDIDDMISYWAFEE